MSSPAPLPEYSYRLFGLDFISEKAIPAIPETGGVRIKDAIHIQFGPVPTSLRSPEYEDATVQATADEFLFQFPGIGRVYVRGGDRIVVERAEHVEETVMWQVILGAGASIAGFRRGFLPIHASSVVSGDDCVALAGQSTAGKSTQAALLNRLGYALHADDLCLADATGECVTVGAGIPELRLSDQSVSMAGWEQVQPFATMREAAKSVYRWKEIGTASRRLTRIYVLEFASEKNEPGIYRLLGLAALEALIDSLRLRLPLLLTGQAEKNFERVTALSQRIPIYRFVRPRDAAQSRRWTDSLAAHLDTHTKEISA